MLCFFFDHSSEGLGLDLAVLDDEGVGSECEEMRTRLALPDQEDDVVLNVLPEYLER